MGELFYQMMHGISERATEPLICKLVLDNCFGAELDATDVD